MEFVIVTGLSGAGKSRAVDALEDIGFYCVDNMPPKLLPKFAELCMQSQNKLSKVAIVMDVRGGELFNDLFDGLDDLKRQCGDYKILFLECDDQVLARRYKETRRQHPLAAANDNSVLKAIAAERLLLKPVRPHRLSGGYFPSVHLPAQGTDHLAVYGGFLSGDDHSVYVLRVQIRLSGRGRSRHGRAMPAQSFLCG